MKSTIVKFTAKPEYKDTFAATLKEAQAATQKEVGNKEIRVFVSKAEDNVFFVYERWADKAAITAHDNEPHTKKLIEVGQTALQSAPDFYFLGDTNPLPDHSKSANPEDDVFIIFFIFKIRTEFRKALIEQFENHITHTRKEEEGNILFDLYTVDNQEDTLAVYEHWRKESDVWDIHFNQPYAVKTGKLMEEAVIGDLKQYMNFVTEI
ncbi:antibiotic biosynthesis monooxygenase [Cellulophaga sp. HaHa_2_95]|uniref:putative quinol monooxygenase n=1 Tax=Cellulophaga sp. HaHa_2_95 TaxID=2745558 RepID=UPI001C502777|nr:antibiotic biosynthesis monooxygenase [Cellulophaga sp. HaHa_2_95]QXP57978.1 antibiotic biosynthesis monooxygenase [Cellulophaga sp. HaHa_2_95]